MTIKPNLCSLVYLLLFVIFILQSTFYPNFILSEEHHYLEVASNMFYYHYWGLMQDTMGVYLSKPPLLFWMLSGLWSVFGPHTWVVHFLLMATLAGVLYLTQQLSQLLFNDSAQAKLAPVIVLGSILFFARGTNFCFDILVVLFFVLSAIGVSLALKKNYVQGFLLFGIAVGLGVLTKGPIILAFCLPFFIVATFLRREYGVQDRAWFFGFFFSVLVMLGLMLTWLIPVLHQLGPVRKHMLLLRRGFGVGATYGAAPFYFYFKAGFFLMFPWVLWPYGVRSFFCALKKNHNPGFKLVFYSLILSLVILSLIPPKALRYAMSSLVLFALLYAYALSQNKPVFSVQANSTRGVLILLTGFIIAAEIVTLFFPQWVMSNIYYPAITYSWVLFFESLMVMAGVGLACLPKRHVIFESIRLCVFTFVLVMGVYVLPHEVLSMSFDYQSFVTYLNELKQQKDIPIIYCRAYGGYQYSMTTPPLPEGKYKLTAKEGGRHEFVYFVAEVEGMSSGRNNYLYRLVDPSQTSAIVVRKLDAQAFVRLPAIKQQCS
ncbi:MAG: glycosyltransferase family 39 protein [Gammaproteobacteria bacterium]|nr:glycosyltransferase family 39 protein [Gammaproteobacteria bacterium]